MRTADTPSQEQLRFLTRRILNESELHTSNRLLGQASQILQPTLSLHSNRRLAFIFATNKPIHCCISHQTFQAMALVTALRLQNHCFLVNSHAEILTIYAPSNKLVCPLTIHVYHHNGSLTRRESTALSQPRFVF